MANQKSLYGQLNQGTSSPANYGGVTSDTAKVTVDNINRTIRADVLWNAFTGETPDKAYPGDKGARNYQKIIELQSKLNEENLRFIGYKDSIEAQLSKITSDLSQLTVEAKQAIQTESNRSKSFDDDISSRLKAEIDRATKAESKLLTQLLQATSDWQSTIQEIQSQINSLEGISGDVVRSIQDSLTAEIGRSTRADAELSLEISKEEKRASDAEDLLSDKLIQLSQRDQKNHADIVESLEREITLREQSLSDLNTRLNLEVERALKADSDLTDLLRTQNKSISQQRQTINGISSQVTDHDSRISSIEKYTIDSDKTTLALNTTVENHTKQLEQAQSEISELENLISDAEEKLDELNGMLIRTNSSTAASIESINTRLNTIDSTNTKQQESILVLRNNLDKEIKDREQSDESLRTEINEERTRAVQSESETKETLNNFQNRVNERFSLVEDTYETLRDQNDAAHSNIHKVLKQQEWICEQFEHDVNHRFADLGEAVDKLEEKIENIPEDSVVTIQPQTGESTYLYGQHKDAVKLLRVDNQPVADSVVQRDSSGNILVPSIDGPLDGAVSRSYVDNKVDKLIDELDEIVEKMINVEFIDGGTAPINRK